MRFKFDKQKSAQCRSNPKRGIGFEEARQLWEQPHYLDQRSERLRASDKSGEYLHLVTLWQSTKEERRLYEENSQHQSNPNRRTNRRNG